MNINTIETGSYVDMDSSAYKHDSDFSVKKPSVHPINDNYLQNSVQIIPKNKNKDELAQQIRTFSLKSNHTRQRSHNLQPQHFKNNFANNSSEQTLSSIQIVPQTKNHHIYQQSKKMKSMRVHNTFVKTSSQSEQ